MKSVIYLITILFINSANSQNWLKLNEGVGSFGVTNMESDSTNNLLYVTGNFQSVDGIPIKYIAKWNGFSWDSLGNGISDRANDMCLFSNQLYICGYFKINGKNIKQISRWNGNGWDSLKIQPDVRSPKKINTIYPINNFLLIGGQFDSIGGIKANSISKWNDTIWSDLAFPDFYPNNPFTYSIINAICSYNYKIYVGGLFYTYPIDTVGHILSNDGTGWNSVSGGIKGSVVDISSLIVFKNELYVAGMFSKSQGNAGDNIQRWDGSIWKDVAGGTNSQIHQLFIFKDELYAVGSFSFAGGIPADKIAKYDGIKWCGLGSKINNNVISGTAFNDSFFIGGAFDIIDSDTILSVAKWNGNNSNDTCQSTASIYKTYNSSIYIYPNPAISKLFIKSELEINKIKLINIFGNVIFHQNLNQKQVNIDLSIFESGIYFLELETKYGYFAKKIIKE